MGADGVVLRARSALAYRDAFASSWSRCSVRSTVGRLLPVAFGRRCRRCQFWLIPTLLVTLNARV
jgi:hypothetical protein